MRKFWSGVLAGVSGTLLLCAGIFIAVNVFFTPWMRSSLGGGERHRWPPMVLHGMFGSRGEFGVIDEITGRIVTLINRDGDKKALVLTDGTVIYRGPTKIEFPDLSKGQRLVVIGEVQADGSIRVKLIRVVSSGPILQGLPSEGY